MSKQGGGKDEEGEEGEGGEEGEVVYRAHAPVLARAFYPATTLYARLIHTRAL